MESINPRDDSPLLEGEEDITEGSEVEDQSTLLQQVLFRLNPKFCMGEEACSAIFDEKNVGETIQPLLKDLKSEGKSRSVALQHIYHLTNKDRRQNR
jgi:hypothetical protein